MKKQPLAGIKLDAAVSLTRINAGVQSPWPPRAHLFTGRANSLCASGNWCAYVSFEREDFSTWYYPFLITSSETDALNAVYGWAGYPFETPGAEYMGLKHTGKIYDTPLDEVAAADITAYLAAH